MAELPASTDVHALGLTFSLRAGQQRRFTRRYAVVAVVDGVKLPGTEELRSPATFATPIVVPRGFLETQLVLAIDGLARESVVLSGDELRHANRVGHPVTLKMRSVSINVYTASHEPELATIRAKFRIASRGVLNSPRVPRVPDCYVVISRRRGDGSWDTVYRSRGGAFAKDAGGSLLSSGMDDGSDVALRVEVFVVGHGGYIGALAGSLMCSLRYLCKKEVGSYLALTDADGRRAGFCVLRDVKTGKADSEFVMDVFAYGRLGPDANDLALVMANDAMESMPPQPHPCRIPAEDLVFEAKKRTRENNMRSRKGILRVGNVLRVFRMPLRMSRMNDAALKIIGAIDNSNGETVLGDGRSSP